MNLLNSYELLEIYEEEYFPMFVDLNGDIPSFREYLNIRVPPIIGRKVWIKNNWHLI